MREGDNKTGGNSNLCKCVSSCNVSPSHRFDDLLHSLGGHGAELGGRGRHLNIYAHTRTHRHTQAQAQDVSNRVWRWGGDDSGMNRCSSSDTAAAAEESEGKSNNS